MRNPESQPQYYPVVYHPAPLASFLEHILDTNTSPTTLVICTDRPTFLAQLKASMEHAVAHPRSAASGSDEAHEQPIHPRYNQSHPLLTRTIHLLAACQTVKLAFCTSVPALHAYLSAYPRPPNISIPTENSGDSWDSAAGKTGTPILALLGVVALHRETPSFSAQGLGRVFAAAVEAAVRGGQRLLVVEAGEVAGEDPRQTEQEQGREDVVMDDANAVDVNVNMGGEGEAGHGVDIDQPVRGENAWEQEVPILNATTKTFGGLGDRGWFGRTVMVADVVGRWAVFREMPRKGRGPD